MVSSPFCVVPCPMEGEPPDLKVPCKGVKGGDGFDVTNDANEFSPHSGYGPNRSDQVLLNKNESDITGYGFHGKEGSNAMAVSQSANGSDFKVGSGDMMEVWFSCLWNWL
ncbi:hypothetical protein AMTR_s00112p00102980 [Amborella trichopoda]|uniref:Uncharacterized protein n=1 Tax=Amborella trichopoda TaxID=13333 RepID=W1NSM5_AMBTC|nr:hypothetical protein AMTR_s00112p00102980 [Amborella trichopoda]